VQDAVKCLGMSVCVRNCPVTCRLIGELSVTADAFGRLVMLQFEILKPRGHFMPNQPVVPR